MTKLTSYGVILQHHLKNYCPILLKELLQEDQLESYTMEIQGKMEEMVNRIKRKMMEQFESTSDFIENSTALETINQEALMEAKILLFPPSE